VLHAGREQDAERAEQRARERAEDDAARGQDQRGGQEQELPEGDEPDEQRRPLPAERRDGVLDRLALELDAEARAHRAPAGHEGGDEPEQRERRVAAHGGILPQRGRRAAKEGGGDARPARPSAQAAPRASRASRTISARTSSSVEQGCANGIHRSLPPQRTERPSGSQATIATSRGSSPRARSIASS